MAAPLTDRILRALSEGPRRQAELAQAAGQPAQTTLRAQLRRLCDAGAIERQRHDRVPGVLEYELSQAGDDLLPIGAILARWLLDSPRGALELGSSTAKAAVKALTDAWSATMLRALATGPLTLTELDGVIASLNYPSVERRLAAMRLAGLVEAREGKGRGTPYGLSGWARRGIGPILAAARWEHSHAPADTAPLAKLDVETAFLLAAGLLSPPAEVSGSCRLAVELRNEKGSLQTGALLAVDEGRVTACTTRLEGDPDAWASGSAPVWVEALRDRGPDSLELGGDGALVRALVGSLRNALFALPVA